MRKLLGLLGFWLCLNPISARESKIFSEQVRLESIFLHLLEFEEVPITECLKVIRSEYDRRKSRIPIYQPEALATKKPEINFETPPGPAPVSFSAYNISTWNAIRAVTASVGLEVEVKGDDWIVTPRRSSPPFTFQKTTSLLNELELPAIQIEKRSPSQAFAKVLYKITEHSAETFPMYVYHLVAPPYPGGEVLSITIKPASARESLDQLAKTTGAVVTVSQSGHLQIYAPWGLKEMEAPHARFDFRENYFKPYSIWPDRDIFQKRFEFMMNQRRDQETLLAKARQSRSKTNKVKADPFGGGGMPDYAPFGVGDSSSSEPVPEPFAPVTSSISEYTPPEPPDVEIQVLDLEGKSIPLKSLWKSKDALIVTGSWNSERAVDTCEQLNQIASEFKDSCNVFFIYTRKAHGSSHHRPLDTTLKQRIVSAKDFKRILKIDVPIYVDFMDNKVWESLGWSPNAALFVAHDGGGYRQGVFDPEKLIKKLDQERRRRHRATIHNKIIVSSSDFDQDALLTTIPVKARNPKTGKIEYTRAKPSIEKLRDALDKSPELVHYYFRPNRKGAYHSRTYLHEAVSQGRLDVVKLLLERGAGPNAKDLVLGETALHYALKSPPGENEIKIVKQLLEVGDVNALTNDQQNGVHIAVKTLDLTNLNLAAKAGGNLSQLSIENISPLHEALYLGKSKTVQRLLELGVEIDTPALAGLGRNEAFIDKVTKQPGLMNQFQGESGRTPLIYAAIAGNTELVEYLTKHSKYTYAHLKACFLKALEFEQFKCGLILAGSIEPYYFSNYVEKEIRQAPNPIGWDDWLGNFSVIHQAAKTNQSAIVNKLIDHGWHPDYLDKNERTPLHVAATNGHLETIKSLVQRGATIDARKGYRNIVAYPGYIDTREPYKPPKKTLHTPLHYAVGGIHADCVEYLLSKGADPKLTDQRGDSALFKLLDALQKNEAINRDAIRKILHLLLESGSSLNEENSDQKKLRALAAEQVPKHERINGEWHEVGKEPRSQLILELLDEYEAQQEN